MEHKLSATLELKDQFTTKIHNAEYALKRFEGNAQKVQQTLKNGFSRGFSKLKEEYKKNEDFFNSTLSKVKTIGIAGGAAAIGMIHQSFTKYAQLNETLIRNASIIKATREEQEKLSKQTRQLGRDSQYSALEVAQAQKYQAMAGYKTNEILAMTPKLLKFATASGEDLASASDILTDNLDAFGLKKEEADKLMDSMTATANNANTNIAMLGEAYKYVAPTSKGFDSFEEVNIMLGILANNGIKAGQAGRNLAGIYTSLSNPSQEMLKMMVKTNTTLYDKQGHFKGLRKIIEETRPKLEKLTDAERNQWLATVAGAEGLKIWNSIMNYSVEGTKNLEKAVYNSKGTVEEMNKKMSETPEYKIKALKSAFEELQLSLGEGVAPVALEYIQDLTFKINEMTSSKTFSKENVNEFFENLVDKAKWAIGILAGVKTATFAVAHPYIAGGVGAFLGANYFLEKTGVKDFLKEQGKEYYQAKADKELRDFKLKSDQAENLYKLDFGTSGRGALFDALEKQKLGYFSYHRLVDSTVQRNNLDMTMSYVLKNKNELKSKEDINEDINKRHKKDFTKRQFVPTEPIKVQVDFKNELQVKNETTNIDEVVKLTTQEFANQFSKKLRLATATTQ